MICRGCLRPANCARESRAYNTVRGEKRRPGTRPSGRFGPDPALSDGHERGRSNGGTLANAHRHELWELPRAGSLWPVCSRRSRSTRGSPRWGGEAQCGPSPAAGPSSWCESGSKLLLDRDSPFLEIEPPGCLASPTTQSAAGSSQASAWFPGVGYIVAANDPTVLGGPITPISMKEDEPRWRSPA